MKRFIVSLIILIAISAAQFYFLSMPRNMGNERAVGGVLDLTRADFERTRHNLDGEWEFFFGALYVPENFAAGAVEGGVMFDVPGSWHNAGFPLYGSATYRLTVKTNEPSLLMFIPHITSASVVWIDGEKVFEAGTVGEQTHHAIGGRNAFVHFHPQGGQTEIIVQASNYAWFFSGLNFSIEIGRPALVYNDAILRRILLGVFIGILVAMFLYHLILFFHHNRDWAYLAFAAFCAFAAMRFYGEANGPHFLFGYYTHVTRSAFQVLVALKTAALLACTHFVFKMPVGRVRGVIYAITMSVPVFIAIFLPFGTVDSRLAFLPLASLSVVFFGALRSKKLHENYYNYLYIIALGFFCVLPFIERFVLSGQLYMPSAAHNLFMVLVQFFILSENYAEAKSAEARLSADNAALEKLSQMKTEYIANMSHESKTPLTVISVHMQLAASILQERGFDDEEITASLKRAQEEIMKLSEINNDALQVVSEFMEGER